MQLDQVLFVLFARKGLVDQAVFLKSSNIVLGKNDNDSDEIEFRRETFRLGGFQLSTTATFYTSTGRWYKYLMIFHSKFWFPNSIPILRSIATISGYNKTYFVTVYYRQEGPFIKSGENGTKNISKSHYMNHYN